MKRSGRSSRNRPLLIVLEGLVGAGKSTQMSLLSSILPRMFCVKTVTGWIKTNHLAAHAMLRLLSLILGVRESSPRYYLDEGRKIFNKVYPLWLLLDMLSIAVKYLWIVIMKSFRRDVVIIEEYMPAVVADYYYFRWKLGRKGLLDHLATSLALKIHAKKPSITVFLYADKKDLKERWRRRGSNPELDEYLKAQMVMLRRIAEAVSPSILVINTSEHSIAETTSIILKAITAMGDISRCRAG